MAEESRLRQLRKARGLKIRQVAELMDVKEDRVRKWETGASTMNVVQAAQVADILHCSIDELVEHGRESLSADELELIRLYRSTDQRGKETILTIARSQSGDAGQVEAGMSADEREVAS